MTYLYSKLQGQSEKILSVYPLVPVTLVYKHQLIKTPIFALVDSGAEYCYCLKTIGDYLRIKFQNKNKVTSLAANNTEFVGYREIITGIVNGKRIEIPFVFSSNLNPSFPLILGQTGFFPSLKFVSRNLKILSR